MFANIFSTLVDFEPYPSLILFTRGCNLRCNYCYNYELVLPEIQDTLFNISMEEADKIIDEFKPFIDGIVISGGEPTLHQEKLTPFLEKQKQKGLKIKIDSNLTIPIRNTFLRHIDGISFTIKPFSYYKPVDIINIKNNLSYIEVSDSLSWKEVRITVVNDKSIQTSVASLCPYLKTWKITIHNAVLPADGVLAEDYRNLFLSYTEYHNFVNNYINPYLVDDVYNVEVKYA